VPSALTRRLTVAATVAAAALPVTVGALLAGAVPALAGTSTASATSPVATPAALAPISHPDADHMGSTIRAHQPATTVQPQPAAPRMLSLTGAQPAGMDVSSLQGNVDWATAAANGATFAYIKATEATGYVNPYLASQYTGSYAAGVIRGTYHFALPDRSTGAAQASYFLSHLGGWSPDGKTLPPMLDMEYNPYGATCYGRTPGQLAAWIADFSNTVNAATGRYPTIYTTTDWWTYCLGNNASFGATNPLFIASYTTTPGVMPPGWGYQSIWQYNDHGILPGDADVFNGSLTQLRQFAGTPPVTPAPAPAPQVPAAASDPITARYAQFGFGGGYLGGTLGGEYAVAGGTAQNYDGGRIYYSPATGARVVHGAILTDYLALGGPAGRLGLPGTDELPTADGAGRYNHFTGSGGASIYWTPASGAHAIQGAVRTLWAAAGWEGGLLGYPITDESTTPDGVGRYNHFTGSAGSIYWTPASAAHEVHGAIAARWAALGWERSPLGYPTSNEYTVTGGRANTFTHGTITWTAATGATTVRYQ